MFTFTRIERAVAVVGPAGRRAARRRGRNRTCSGGRSPCTGSATSRTACRGRGSARPARLLAVLDRRPPSIEHMFVSTERAGILGRLISRGRRSAAQYAAPARAAPRSMTFAPRAARPPRPAPAERVLRRGRVRARHVAAHADHGARARGQPARPGRPAHHERPAALHRRDAARRDDLLAGDRRARRAGARARFDAVHGDVPRGRPRAADRHLPARRDRRARAEGDRAQPPGASWRCSSRRPCAGSSSSSGR